MSDTARRVEAGLAGIVEQLLVVEQLEARGQGPNRDVTAEREEIGGLMLDLTMSLAAEIEEHEAVVQDYGRRHRPHYSQWRSPA